MLRIRGSAALVAISFVAAASTSAAAEGDPPAGDPVPREERGPGVLEMEEIVVAATRREGALFASPVSISVVGREEIQGERLRRTLPDALLDLPAAMVQRTAHGQASPFLRGFTGYQTVLLVDGIRLNNSTFRSGPNQYWSTVDSFTVESLEVVRGASSVLYGSDAAGGAVLAVTRRREDFEPGNHGGIRSVFRAASAERSLTARVEGEGNAGDLGILAGATSRDYGDLRAGRGTGRLPETGYREGDADLRLDWRETPRTTWTLALQHVAQTDVPRTETTVHAVPFRGTSAGTELRRDLDQVRNLAYLRMASGDAGLPWADRVEITLSGHRQLEEQERDRTGARTDVQETDVRTLGLQAQVEKGTGAGTFTWGVEWWRDSVSSSRRDFVGGALVLEEIQGPVADDASYDLAGVFVQDEIPLGTGGTLVPGARFTWAAARAGRVDDPTVPGADPATPGNVLDLRDSWSDVTGSLRAVQPVGEDWNLFGGVSRAFRAPNLSDLTRLDDTSGVETPRLGLDPEEFVNAEVGTRVGRGRWSLQASAWRTWIDGLIVPSPTGVLIGSTPEVRKDNVGDGWVHGIDAESALRFEGGWTVSGAATWMKGEVDQLLPSGRKVSAPLSRAMPATGTLTLRWSPRSTGWDLWVSGRAADGQDRLSLKDATDTRRIPPGGTPGYGVVSLGAGYEVSEHARIDLVVENLLDRDYRIHGSGVNEPGRNLVLGLELAF